MCAGLRFIGLRLSCRGHRYGKFKLAGRFVLFSYRWWPVRRSKCAGRLAVVFKCTGRLAFHRLAPILSWLSVWDHAGRFVLPPYVRPGLSVEMCEPTCGSFQMCGPVCASAAYAPACARNLARRLASAGFHPALDNIGRKPHAPGRHGTGRSPLIVGEDTIRNFELEATGRSTQTEQILQTSNPSFRAGPP